VSGDFSETSSRCGSPLHLNKIQAGIGGEIYPVFANYASSQRQDDRNISALSKPAGLD
jgi:hypothetical protein